MRNKLSGVRWHHLHAGLPNPLENKFRLTSALKALKRLRGDSTGKLPVTPQVLRHIRSCLDLNNPRHATMWAATTFGPRHAAWTSNSNASSAGTQGCRSIGFRAVQ